MPVNWSVLPPEIWLLIFDRVRDVKQLAECRLVSRAWDPLAERAMFSQPLIFKHKNNLTEFYHHLAKKPYLGHCIKDMNFTITDMDALPFHKEFFQLAFTPTIQKVYGNVSDKSFQMMLDIAQRSTKKFEKITRLPLPYRLDKAIHVEVALYFRQSLQDLKLIIDDNKPSNPGFLQPLLFSRLNEFESLTDLKLLSYSKVDNLAVVDDILNGCSHLLKLDIAVRGFRDDPWIRTDKLNAWMMQNVKKCLTACHLIVFSVTDPQLVEYLCYKYPNAGKIILSSNDSAERKEETTKRCLHAVKNLSTVAIVDWKVANQKLLKDFITTIKSQDNILAIHVDPSLADDCIALAQATRRKSTGLTNFSIAISSSQPVSFLREIVAYVGVNICQFY